MLVFFLLALQASFNMDASGFKLTMQGTKKVVEENEPYDLLCLSDVPLQHCQIKSDDVNEGLYEVVRDKAVDTEAFSLSGDGLLKGYCGVSIKKPPDPGVYVIYACRGRTATSGWQYDSGMVLTAVADEVKRNSYPVTTGPTTLYVDEGNDVEFTFESVLPFAHCKFKWADEGTWTETGSSSKYSIVDADKDKGRCGLQLLGVTGASSGLVEANFKTAQGETMVTTTLIVNTPPTAPVLTLSQKDGNYNSSDYLQASCFVGPGRPIARIEWLLGDDIIRNDAQDDSDSANDFKWEYEARCITQYIYLKLTKADYGKELICRAEHIAWPGGRKEDRKRIFIAGSENSDILLLLTWFLIGIASVSLGVAITVACLIGTTYATKTWCFEIRPE